MKKLQNFSEVTKGTDWSSSPLSRKGGVQSNTAQRQAEKENM